MEANGTRQEYKKILTFTKMSKVSNSSFTMVIYGIIFLYILKYSGKSEILIKKVIVHKEI